MNPTLWDTPPPRPTERVISPLLNERPAQEESQESVEAAIDAGSFAAHQRRRVYEWLSLNGPATADAIEAGTGISGNSVRPRLGELLASGAVRHLLERGRTRSGRSARLWEAV